MNEQEAMRLQPGDTLLGPGLDGTGQAQWTVKNVRVFQGGGKPVELRPDLIDITIEYDGQVGIIQPHSSISTRSPERDNVR